ncbi:MAG TPA: bifunctional 2-keto-4-hydroxyglutarate aldolase/2-keto-3-deoxy-6-phosphogluconate aldolase [Pseudogracilibacillus sp.]|nr:bifunctional 2-keto-4-hydroxyglutarate aldolase/2-keto-3-deoxy-6-phosphogluconate aldolase [Pseudogracilibacillus sp.]
MQRYDVLQQMTQSKLAVVIRGETMETAEKTADACVQGGVRTLEVTFTVPHADQLMERLAAKYADALVGAGTVLDSETARIAILSGAQFIVSPTFDIGTVKLCNRYSVPYLPGCMTVNEMMQAMEYGVSIVKLFPGQLFEPSFIKNLQGPLPTVQIMPTGGINLDNVQSWLQAGAIFVGVGGEITAPAKHEDYEQVKALAASFVEKVSEG